MHTPLLLAVIGDRQSPGRRRRYDMGAVPDELGSTSSHCVQPTCRACLPPIERFYHHARARAEAAGLPFVMPAVARRRDVAALGGWIGAFRNGQPVTGYLATDGHRLHFVPVRFTRMHRWAQPFDVDLDTVTGTDAAQLPYGARRLSAVALHLRGADGEPADLTLGSTNWDKAGVEHSPLARFVQLPTSSPRR